MMRERDETFWQKKKMTISRVEKRGRVHCHILMWDRAQVVLYRKHCIGVEYITYNSFYVTVFYILFIDTYLYMFFII